LKSEKLRYISECSSSAQIIAFLKIAYGVFSHGNVKSTFSDFSACHEFVAHIFLSPYFVSRSL
jgi:hypothetical protein